MSFYEQLSQDRQNWLPVALPQNERLKCESNGVPEAVERCLALALHLELPVGAFIGSAVKSDLPAEKEAINLLKSNIADETRHEKAFQYASKVYPVSDKISHEAGQYAERWINSPEHTIVKAAVLELGVFLVSLAILRNFGGQSLDRLATDISLDENRHVSTNWSLMDDLNLDVPTCIRRLQEDTLDFVCKDITDNKFDTKFWKKQGSDLMRDLEAPDLDYLFYTPQISFFEISNKHISAYG